MPYRRRTSIRRRRRRTPWYNRKYSTMQLAKKAWRGVKMIRGLVNSERMYQDTFVGLGQKSKITLLNGLAVGDNNNNRTGNSVLMRSLYLRGFIQIHPSVTVNSRVCVMLVWDTQQIADTTPAITDILTNDNPEAVLNTAMIGYTAGRFKILMRKNYNLIPGQRPTINIDKYFKLYKHAKYNGTAATDIQKNGLYCVVLSSEVTNFPTCNVNARLGYHDN